MGFKPGTVSLLRANVTPQKRALLHEINSGPNGWRSVDEVQQLANSILGPTSEAEVEATLAELCRCGLTYRLLTSTLPDDAIDDLLEIVGYGVTGLGEVPAV